MSVVRRGYKGRHVWRTSQRRKAARGAALGAAVVGLFASVLPLAAPASAAACTLAPKLMDVTINQGLGANTLLARGKDTLVKLYLTLPDCANAGDTITISSTSTLTVTGSNSAGTVVPQFTVPMSNAGGYGLGPATAAAYANQPGDPVFLIPGSMLQPTDTAIFTLTVSASIAFVATPGTGSASTRGPSPAAFSTKPGGSAPITSTFERRTNALRVLVVKMIDPQGANTFDSKTTTINATTAIAGGMAQLSRVLPLPNGIKDLTCNPTTTADCGGLRYSFATGAIDLRAVPSTANGVTTYYNMVNTLNPVTKKLGFCDGDGDILFAQLQAMRQSWNAANALTPADRVVGVVDEADSIGTTTAGSVPCADGMAAFPGTAGTATTGWVRACYKTCLVPATTGTGPSITGSLLAMELSHTIGLVPAARDNKSLHSPNVHADSIPAQTPYRTFYLPTRLPMVNASTVGVSHSVMDYASDPASTWNDSDTLLEQPDWAYWQCALGGTPSAECGTQVNGVGTQLGVPAGGLFTITGSTGVDPTTQLPSASTTRVADSFRSPSQALQTVTSPTSPYHLQQVGTGGAICRDDGIPVSSADQHVAVGGPALDAHIATFDAAVPFAAGCASRIELRYISGSTNILLYARAGNNAPPQVVARTVAALPGPGPITPFMSTTDNISPEPALSADAQWVALATGADGSAQVGVTSATPPAAGSPVITTLNAPSGSADAAWRYETGSNSRMLAFVGSHSAVGYGDIYTVSVDTGGPVPVFGVPTQLTNGQQMRDPSWSRDGTSLVVEGVVGSAGTIMTFPATRGATDPFVTPRVIAPGVSSANLHYFEPAWSHTAGDNRIAFSRLVDSTGSVRSLQIVTVDPTAPDPVSTMSVLVNNGLDAVWDDEGRIAFMQIQRGLGRGNIAIVRSDSSSMRTLTSNVIEPTPGPVDEFVSLAQGKIFFQRSGAPSAGAPPSIVSMTLSAPSGPAVTVTANATAPDQLANLRLGVRSTCPQAGSAPSPVVAGLTPFATTDLTATFSAVIDTTGTCAGTSQLTAVVNDGFQQAAPTPAGTASPPAASPPQAAIVNPLVGSSYLQWATIPASGIVRDAQDGDVTATSTWSLRNASNVTVASGTGAGADFRPGAAGWAPGSYTLTLAATDSSGASGSRTVPLTILADADRDGVADAVEQLAGCFPPGHDTDPYDAWRDYDGDGLVNVDDPAPCAAAAYYLAQEKFSPNRLNVRSQGQAVTVDIALTFSAPMGSIVPNTVQIQKIQGQPVSGFTDIKWNVTGTNTAVAQFSRPDLINYLVAHNLVDRTVTFQVGGGSGTASFDGACDTYVAST